MVDWQAAFNFVAGIAGAFGAWVMKMIIDDIRDIQKYQAAMPETYARRDDVKEIKKELLDALIRIETKIDRKYAE